MIDGLYQNLEEIQGLRSGDAMTAREGERLFVGRGQASCEARICATGPPGVDLVPALDRARFASLSVIARVTVDAMSSILGDCMMD